MSEMILAVFSYVLGVVWCDDVGLRVRSVLDVERQEVSSLASPDQPSIS